MKLSERFSRFFLGLFADDAIYYTQDHVQASGVLIEPKPSEEPKPKASVTPITRARQS